MKKLVLFVIVMLVAFGSVLTAQAGKEKFEAGVGDVIYVCGCGEGCTCGTIAKQEGTCACGTKLVKTTVTRIENGRAFYKVDGAELSASLTGKYYCSCDKCDCATISQKAGKCGCGKELVQMKKSSKE